MLKTLTFVTIARTFVLLCFLLRAVGSSCENDFERGEYYARLFSQDDLKHQPSYLGEGTSGVVVRSKWWGARTAPEGDDVAVKIARTLEGIDSTEGEEAILEDLNRLRLAHVPKLYSCFYDQSGSLYLVTSYLQTSLQTVDLTLMDNTPVYKKFFDEGTVVQRLTFYRKLAVALNELYVNNYFHGDLKPENIMFDGRPEEIFDKDVVLIDFGATRPLDYTELSGGSPAYMDHEAELRYCYDNKPKELPSKIRKSPQAKFYSQAGKVDIWALAAIIYEFENSRRGKTALDAFDFMSDGIDCRNIEHHSNALRFRRKVLKDEWLDYRGLDFEVDGQPVFKNLLDDMTKLMRGDRLITMTDVVARLTQMIDHQTASNKPKGIMDTIISQVFGGLSSMCGRRSIKPRKGIII